MKRKTRHSMVAKAAAACLAFSCAAKKAEPRIAVVEIPRPCDCHSDPWDAMELSSRARARRLVQTLYEGDYRKNRNVRKAAAELIGAGSTAAPHLISLLGTTTNINAQSNALYVLGELRSFDAVPVIIYCIGNPDALRALKKIADSSRAPSEFSVSETSFMELVRLMGDEDEAARRDACMASAYLRDFLSPRERTELLFRLYGVRELDEDPSVQAAAAFAIEKLAAADHNFPGF